MSGAIHIALAFDQNYLRPFYALLTSIFARGGPGPFHFHLIAPGIEEKVRLQIVQFVENNGAAVTFYNVDQSLVSKFVVTSQWTPAVYYRLFFPILVPPAITRLLYLDTDIIVTGPLAQLFREDIEGYPVGAVYDNYVKKQPLIGLPEEGRYFNSGVLLMDVPLWNRLNISEQAISFLQEFPEKILFVDQCALNAVLIGKWKRLPEKYNLLYSYLPDGLSREKREALLESNTVIHFTLQRPWTMLCKNRFRNLYFRYLRASPLKYEKGYADFSWRKVIPFVKIRLIECYRDFPVAQKLWSLRRRIL